MNDNPIKSVIPNDEQCALASRLYAAHDIYLVDACQILAERDWEIFSPYQTALQKANEKIEVLRAELATQKVQNSYNWQFQEISESALKRAEATEHDCRVLIGQLNDAEAKLSGIRAAVIEACRNAQMKVFVWYPENTRSYIHPNKLGEIYEKQTTECVAAIERVFEESGRRQEGNPK